jgi:DNA adenine methylase
VVLSNSNSDYVKTLYRKFDTIKIKSTRNINCDPGKRKDHHDLIILNYDKKIKDKKIISEINNSSKAGNTIKG